MRLISTSDSAVLEFGEIDAEFFLVSYRATGLDASARVSSYMSSGFSEFFAGLAAHWKGWEGTREWRSLEGELTLRATTDRSGHVTLSAVLLHRQPYSWRLEGQIVLEAGQLARTAEHARDFASRAIRSA